MKYTKGPWTGTTTSGSSDDVCAYIIESKDRYIADVHVHTTDDGMVAQANANLIAAAPEMFEALELCLESFRKDEVTPELHNQIVNVLKKARGE